jgi:hypothetical protein
VERHAVERAAALDGYDLSDVLQLTWLPAIARSSPMAHLRLRQASDPEINDRFNARDDAELLTHLTPQDITTPTFTWHRLEHTGDGETYIQSGPLVLRFGIPAGQQAPPLLMRLTWRGERSGQRMSQHLDVTGHRQLRLRPFDATRDTLTNYPVFDERLLALYERLAAAGYQHHQLQAFCRLLTAICRVGLRMTWDRDYRRGTHVTERRFRDDLHERLLAESELDGRLERGSPLALGYLDVRHDALPQNSRSNERHQSPKRLHPSTSDSRSNTRLPTAPGYRFSQSWT